MEPGRDIAIRYCGLRAGEKLHEEVWSDAEVLSETRYEKISVVQSELDRRSEQLADHIEALEERAAHGDRGGIMRELARIFEGMEAERRDGQETAGS